MLVTDLNNDKKPDLITISDERSGGTVSVLLNKGDGGYRPANIYPVTSFQAPLLLRTSISTISRTSSLVEAIWAKFTFCWAPVVGFFNLS